MRDYSKKAKRRHGMSDTPSYSSWSSMIGRCTNPKCVAFPDYGGRGIEVCDRWMDFESFLEDMGERPAGLTLDRINNNGNYEPGNCRWATRKQQHNNRRANRLLSLNGETMTVAEWSEKLEIPLPGLHARLHRKWPVERALEKYPCYLLREGNKSGFPGVSKAKKSWRAFLHHGSDYMHVGCAASPQDAYILRVKKARELGVRLPEGDRFLGKILLDALGGPA